MPKAKFVPYLLVLALFVNVINLLPVVDSPFLGDDAWLESTLRGTVLLSKSSLVDICWNTLADYVRSGRWYPLMIYYYPIFYHFDQYLYKVVTVVLIALNVLLFGYFVQVLTSSKSAGLMAMLLPPLFLQMRCYHDPILAFYYLMQLELLLILASLIWFVRFLQSGSRAKLALSVVTYLFCILIYEAFYAFWMVHALLAGLHFGRHRVRSIVQSVAPIFFVASTNILITLAIRSVYGATYQGISVNPSPDAWIPTYLKQVFAALPLSYFLTTGTLHQPLAHALTYFTNDLVIMCGAWAILWLMVSDWRTSTAHSDPEGTTMSLLLVGLCFWLLPAVFVSLAIKYQQELTWGLGYLPVYVSSFGVAMVALAVILRLYERTRQSQGVRTLFATVTVTIVGVLVCGVTYNSNRMVIHCYNAIEHYHRELIQAALEGGLMNSVRNGAYVTTPLPLFSWATPAFFRMHAGLTVQVVTPSGFPLDKNLGNMRVENAFAGYRVPGTTHLYNFAQSGEDPQSSFIDYAVQFTGFEGPVVVPVVGPAVGRTKRRAYFLKYEALFKGLGYAVLGRMVELKADNTDIYSVCADKIRVYVGIPVGYPYKRLSITGHWTDAQTHKSLGSFEFVEAELRSLASHANGKLFEIPASGGNVCIDPKSIMVNVSLTGYQP